MLWDGLIIVVIVGLAFAGWSIGIINSWRGLIGIPVATIATQFFYVNLATFIVQQLRVSPEQAIVAGYIMGWVAVEIACELILVLIPLGRKEAPTFFERAFGAIFGVVKGLIIVILPSMALLAPIKVPEPPPDKAGLENPIQSSTDTAFLIPIFSNVAKGLKPVIGDFVVSTKEPSFKPNFEGESVLDEKKK